MKDDLVCQATQHLRELGAYEVPNPVTPLAIAMRRLMDSGVDFEDARRAVDQAFNVQETAAERQIRQIREQRQRNDALRMQANPALYCGCTRKQVDGSHVKACPLYCEACDGQGWQYSGVEYYGQQERIACDVCTMDDDLADCQNGCGCPGSCRKGECPPYCECGDCR